MSSDVFILSYARADNAVAAIRQAVELAGVDATRIEDVIFGMDEPLRDVTTESMLHGAGLECASVRVSSSLRALFYASASVLGEDAQLVLVTGVQQGACTAFVLASPEAVGRYNILPIARLAARSLSGPERALRLAELPRQDVQVCKDGTIGAHMLTELLDELESQSARWGMVTVGSDVLLVERI